MHCHCHNSGLLKGETVSFKELLVSLGTRADQRPVEGLVQMNYDGDSVLYLSGDHCVQGFYTKIVVGRIKVSEF